MSVPWRGLHISLRREYYRVSPIPYTADTHWRPPTSRALRASAGHHEENGIEKASKWGGYRADTRCTTALQHLASQYLSRRWMRAAPRALGGAAETRTAYRARSTIFTGTLRANEHWYPPAQIIAVPRPTGSATSQPLVILFSFFLLHYLDREAVVRAVAHAPRSFFVTRRPRCTVAPLHLPRHAPPAPISKPESATDFASSPLPHAPRRPWPRVSPRPALRPSPPPDTSRTTCLCDFATHCRVFHACTTHRRRPATPHAASPKSPVSPNPSGLSPISTPILPSVSYADRHLAARSPTPPSPPHYAPRSPPASPRIVLASPLPASGPPPPARCPSLQYGSRP
ncbi:hypothetical protein FB451DRAFT_1565559 [Mycena latifolia]|nr:hypothetical protein FB451DRAFT_1565559 [Mycena latifolia]